MPTIRVRLAISRVADAVKMGEEAIFFCTEVVRGIQDLFSSAMRRRRAALPSRNGKRRWGEKISAQWRGRIAAIAPNGRFWLPATPRVQSSVATVASDTAPGLEKVLGGFRGYFGLQTRLSQVLAAGKLEGSPSGRMGRAVCLAVTVDQVELSLAERACLPFPRVEMIEEAGDEIDCRLVRYLPQASEHRLCASNQKSLT